MTITHKGLSNELIFNRKEFWELNDLAKIKIKAIFEVQMSKIEIISNNAR